MIIDPGKQSFGDNYKLIIGAIVPRPIAFVSSVADDGTANLAPFSFFNGVCSNPPTLMFAPVCRAHDGMEKDTLGNIRQNGEFAVNIVSEDIAEQMVACSTDYPPDVDEFQVSGLTQAPCQRIRPPRVAQSRISFECKLNQIVQIGDGSPGSGHIVIGTIVLFHIADDLYQDGRIDLAALQPVGRLAGNGYTRTTDNFTITRRVKP